ncbi:MAG: hypothetical protein HQK70_15630 [Desulfamplus sp.]|nr:hypothetical protein [Desulfamplus sp.]
MTECYGISDADLATTNGCGSSYWLAWIFRIPKWFSHEFYCACAEHDILYQEGVWLSDKIFADNLLISKLYESAINDNSFIRAEIKFLVIEIIAFALSTKLSELCFIKANLSQEKQLKETKFF